MADYKVNFKDLKARVGVDDIAYALGYRLDRKAGVGRYIELVLGENGNRRDTIIVSHPNDKAAQTFFRRDGSKGDVVTLIRENLSAFTVSGKDEWQKIAKVMARFANMPEPEYREDREYVKSVKATAFFDASRYEVKPIDTERIPRLFSERGLSDGTVKALHQSEVVIGAQLRHLQCAVHLVGLACLKLHYDLCPALQRQLLMSCSC